MANGKSTGPARWIFTIIMIGGFVSSGIYIGMMRVEGVTTGDLLRAIGFGALGLLMMYRTLSSR